MTSKKTSESRQYLKLTLVILSGGSGTRLWPLSRQQHLKQYLTLVGDKTCTNKTY